MRIVAIVLVLAASTLSCGEPDNLVLGGFNGAIITNVRTAIHGNGQLQPLQAGGTPTPVSVVILSDATDLCNKLGQHPDFFRQSYEVSTALIMWGGRETIGTSTPGLGSTNAEMVVGQSPPDAATPKPPAAYPAGQLVPGSFITLSEFDASPGGEAKGSFDLVLADAGGGGHEFAGHFKTGSCAAIANVLLP